MSLTTLKATNDLKDALVKEYGGFADRRIKKLENGNFFHVDDRSSGDYDARKKLFLWFCTIDLTVHDGQTVSVGISKELPKNAKVTKWWEENSTEGRYGFKELKITPENTKLLQELAALVSDVIRQPYSVKAYRYVAPRTADSLLRLKKTLDAAWASQSQSGILG